MLRADSEVSSGFQKSEFKNVLVLWKVEIVRLLVNLKWLVILHLKTFH